MSNSSCATCHKTKAPLICGICHDSICKNCTQFLEENYFSFLPKLTPELKQTTFCPTCYEQKISQAVSDYNATMEKAKDVVVFEKTQNKVTRLIKRTEKPISVNNCADYDELIMRLAFLAANLNYNAIIDVKTNGKKIVDGTYQTTVWSATAIPANVDVSKLIKDRSIWSNPN